MIPSFDTDFLQNKEQRSGRNLEKKGQSLDDKEIKCYICVEGKKNKEEEISEGKMNVPYERKRRKEIEV